MYFIQRYMPSYSATSAVVFLACYNWSNGHLLGSRKINRYIILAYLLQRGKSLNKKSYTKEKQSFRL